MKHLLLCVLALPLVALADGNKVVLYDGYGSAERFTVEGRVIEAEKLSQAEENDSWWRNLWRNFRLIKNSEREEVALTVKIESHETNTTSDDEGYFRVTAAPAPPLTPGWHAVTAEGRRVRGEGKVLIVPRTNMIGIISDIDDTVLVSEVTDKKKLLENTFLKNPQQRQAFPGTADFYKRLLARNVDSGSAPMFYLSASPRQLAGNIEVFLTQNRFPPGALVTKQINGNGRDPLLDQKQYKIGKIEAIFAALPWVRFVLIGDDGELDPEIYRAMQEKYPQRVAGVYIRKVSPDPGRVVYAGQFDLGEAVGGRR